MIRNVIDLRTGLDLEAAHKLHFPRRKSVPVSWLAYMLWIQSTTR